MRPNTAVIQPFWPSLFLLYSLTLAGCGRTTSETQSARGDDVTGIGLQADSNRLPESKEAVAGTGSAAENAPEATPAVSFDESPPQSVQVVQSPIATDSAIVRAESRLERARRAVETETIIARAVFEIVQGPPTPGEQSLLNDIAAKEQVYQLLAQDIDNDAENLANRGLIMPWELQTRDVQHNLAMGRSPFRRRVSSASLQLSQRIGDEQLESVRQLIHNSETSLHASRIRRAWASMTSEQQALCDKYQPEFAAEASGRNDAELARLTAEIETAPGPFLLISRAKLCATRGDLEQALSDVSLAVSSSLEDEDQARLLRGDLLAELGQTDAAARDYQFVAEKRGPLSERAYVAWGQLLEDLAPTDALDKAEEALKINTNSAAAYALMANAYKNLNLRQATIEALQTAARLAPEDPTHCYRLGNLQSALGAVDEAHEAYTRAIAADPMWWRPYAGRATVHYRRHDLEAALRDLQDAIEWAPREPSIYESRAVVLEDMGRANEAARDRAAAKTLAAGGVL